MLKIELIKKEEDFDKLSISREDYVDFLYNHLDKFGDPKSAINKCLDFAFEKNGGLGGFMLAAFDDDKLVGALVMNNTGMSEFIPENILVYVAVHESMRGKGFGKQIVEKAINMADGNVKLHVEYENPAKRLYERVGFQSKYAEMRYDK
ncbi:MAG: GNAT family N-acetyltransferase [Bacteroidales bacterium]|nr:GNAT family N-acetyltransferase [Bacteroidales bacterium]MCF8328068.1 GNAT family N-acetyltransferase [Bacteroidales bacterium]